MDWATFIGGGAAGAMLAIAIMVFVAKLYETDEKETPGALQNYAAITEGELLEKLLGAPGSPVYQGVRAVIDEEALRLTNAAMEEGLTEAVLRWRLGGAAALAGLAEELESRIKEARQRQEDMEKENPGEKAA